MTDVKICLIATELMGWGAAGGFGFATRSLARELLERGIETTVVLPQPRAETGSPAAVGGIPVRTYPRLAPARAIELFRGCDADIYHSQEPSFGTWLAQRAMPDRVHLVTSRDPRLLEDWWVELRLPTLSRLQVLQTALHYENPLTRTAVRRAANVYVPARCLASRVQRKYGLSSLPGFLPTPVRMPRRVAKARQPTVCIVGRLDRRKRPERALALAARFPEVRFIVAGAAQDPSFGQSLQERYRRVGNVEFRGFVDQFAGDRLSDIFSESWVLLNTSAREGLPNTFIEACAHGCAILSAVDPDGFASGFGHHAADGDFAGGLRSLIVNDRWRDAGARGAAYVAATNAAPAATARHLAEYAAWRERARAPRLRGQDA
jgi:glycosyltransferase involved in cell wall biosynthesis